MKLDTKLPSLGGDLPRVELPPLELDVGLFQDIAGAVLAGTIISAPVQPPDFRSASKNTRRALASALRRLADSIDAQDVMSEETASQSPSDMLETLMHLEDDWDGEGAPKPTRESIERAAHVLKWAESHKVEILDVDADVLGGVAVRLAATDHIRVVWIACMNNAQDTAVWSNDTNVVGHCDIEPGNWQILDQFLTFLGVVHDEGR